MYNRWLEKFLWEMKTTFTVSKYTYTVAPKHANALRFRPVSQMNSEGEPSMGASEKTRERETDRAGMSARVRSTCFALKHQSGRLRSSCLCGQAPLILTSRTGLAGRRLPTVHFTKSTAETGEIRPLSMWRIQRHSSCTPRICNGVGCRFWRLPFCCLINHVLLEMTWLTSAHIKKIKKRPWLKALNFPHWVCEVMETPRVAEDGCLDKIKRPHERGGTF